MPEQKIKLQVANVKMGALEFEGLRNPETGEYAIAVQQVAKLFPDSVRPDNMQKSLKRALGEGFEFVQAYTNRAEGSSQNRPENIITLEQFRKVILKFAYKGDPNAQLMNEILIGVSLENFFNDAFGIKNTPENNQKFVNKFLQEKYEEIVNNSNLNDKQKERKIRIIHLEIELEKDRLEEEKEEAIHSEANKKKFIDDLKQIIRDEWDREDETMSETELKNAVKESVEFAKALKSAKNSTNRDNFYNTNVFVSKFLDKQFIRGQHTTLGRFAKRICDDYNLLYNNKGLKQNPDSEIGLTHNEYPYEILEYLAKNIAYRGNSYKLIKNSLRGVIQKIEELYSNLEECPVDEDEFDFLFD